MLARSALLILALSFAAWTQTAGVPATVEGRVVDSLSGEGVGGASVALTPVRGPRRGTDANGNSRTISGVTLADGSFHLDQVPAGGYFLLPSREGFSLPTKNSFDRYLELHDGQLANGLVLQMVPNVSFGGVVLDPAGNPVPHARVAALMRSQYGAQNTYEEHANAICDANGKFILKGLRRGSYYLGAAPDDPPAQTGGQELVPTLYPRTSTLSDATPVIADPEQPTGDLTIYLRAAFTHSVSGKLGDLATNGDKLTVQLTPRDLAVSAGLFAPTRKISLDRTFSFDHVAAGAYTLRLLNRNLKLLAIEEIDVSSDVKGIVLNPTPPITIRGAAVIDGSTSSSSLPAMTVTARPLDSNVRAASKIAQVGTDGTFQLQGLDPALYVFNVLFRGGNYYLQSLVFNGQNIANRAVDLAQVGAGQMEIHLAAGVGEVDGTIQDSPGAGMSSRLWTVLIPEEIAPDGSNVRISVAKPDGTFALTNVPPGNYQIVAANQADPRIWQNAHFLAQIKNQGSSLNLPENGHLQVEVETIAYPVLQQTAEQVGIYLE